MSKYNVLAIDINNGIITTDFYAKTNSIKKFLADKHITEAFAVRGWQFAKIHLIRGTQENGFGWAFFK